MKADRMPSRRTMLAGLAGALLTQTTQFVRALETIMDGGVYAPVVLTASARRVETAALGHQGLPALTERQLDVLDLLREGCPTKTIALLPSSPAVEAIPAANCTDIGGSPVTTDQRGAARPQGANCDIGAYELDALSPFAPKLKAVVGIGGSIDGVGDYVEHGPVQTGVIRLNRHHR